MTYKNFINKHIVQIPALQRDYVQGANLNAQKRDKFITDILEALEKEEPIDLEFIYGSSKPALPSGTDKSIVQSEEKDYFVPIDGQQRLTTLAILGWLLSRMTQYKTDYNQVPLKEMDYNVRSTTGLFIKHLLDMESLPDLGSEYKSIAEWIRNVPEWYALSWEKDPSVKSMLEILDVLYVRLKGKDNIQQLNKALFEKDIVKFEELDMEEYKLSEDLYVKMNARGKHLTDFENWKAEFYGFILINYGEEKAEEFSNRIEEEWCNLFWFYAVEKWKNQSQEDQEKEYPRIDEFFMNFYHYITFMLFHATNNIIELANKFSEERKNHFSNVNVTKIIHDETEESEEDCEIKKVTPSEVYNIALSKDQFFVYRNKENLSFLFEVLDLLVEIEKKYHGDLTDQYVKRSGIDGWLCEILTDKFDRNCSKINVFSTDGLSIFTKIISKEEVSLPLRTLFYGLLTRIRAYQHSEPLFDFTRVFWGWLLSRDQRLAKNLDNRFDFNVEHIELANRVLIHLNSEKNVFDVLDKTDIKDLSKEKEKASYIQKGKYDVIKILSNHPYIKGNFINIYPILDSLKASDVINNFISFADLSDDDKVLKLIENGSNGTHPWANYNFYGKENHWDYIFSDYSVNKETTIKSSNRLALDAILQGKFSIKNSKYKEFYYYYLKYQEFRNSTDNNYFYIQDDFRVWALQRISSRPLNGYNCCPYAYTVVEKLPDNLKKKLKISQYSWYSDHGKIWIETLGLTLECIEQGWEIEIYDSKKWFKHPNSKNFPMLSKEKWIIPDETPKDRIETAIYFIQNFD